MKIETLGDIVWLIENKTPESKFIDYKKELPKDSDSDRKEFLADVSSFANAEGGYIIYGIKEENGYPVDIEGIENTNPDEVISKYENLVRDSVKPRINLEIKYFKVNQDRYIFVFEIKKSWNRPHMVTYKNTNKFWGRNSNGKYLLDVEEIKHLVHSNTINEEIKNFITNRIMGVHHNDDVPIQLEKEYGKVLFLLIPIESFSSIYISDLEKIYNNRDLLSNLIPSGFENKLYNLEGILIYNTNFKYIQIYRERIIEYVDTYFDSLTNKKSIPSLEYEEDLIQVLSGCLNFLKSEQINPPIVVSLNLINVKGYEFGVKPAIKFSKPKVLDKEILKLPLITIESYDENPAKILKPLFDIIWNAFGYPGSQNYDNNGNFIAK